jgi:hypothetical protein
MQALVRGIFAHEEAAQVAALLAVTELAGAGPPAFTATLTRALASAAQRVSESNSDAACWLLVSALSALPAHEQSLALAGSCEPLVHLLQRRTSAPSELADADACLAFALGRGGRTTAPEGTSIASAAGALIARLAASSTDLQLRFVAAGAAQPLRALLDHGSSREAAAAAQAAAVLARHPSTHQRLLDSGACSALFRCAASKVRSCVKRHSVAHRYCRCLTICAYGSRICAGMQGCTRCAARANLWT